MRLHIVLDDAIVAEMDSKVGMRGRSRFIHGAVRRALDARKRNDMLMEVAGAIPDGEHEWDEDPAEWVRQQRAGDPRRIG